MKLVATAPGKLVVIGEVAVLHGAPALVAAVERRARVVLEPEAGRAWRIDAPALQLAGHALELRDGRVVAGPGSAPALRERLAVLAAVLESAAGLVQSRGGTLRPMHLTTDTSALLAPSGEKLGLGASAAVASAMFQGLCASALASSPDARELLPRVVAAHRAAQGGGSGIDVAASLLGGVVEFSLGEGGAPRASEGRLPREVRLVAVWSGASQRTPAVLAALAEYRRHDPAGHDDRMRRLGGAAADGVAAARGDDAAGFLSAVDAFAGAFAELGRASGVELVSEAHARIGAVVRSAGGVYKPSGAGGDLGLAMAAGDEGAARVEHALRARGVMLLPVQVAATGVSVERPG